MKITFKWAPKKTCWWSNDWNPHHVLNIREDKLFGISRLYVRKLRLYMYIIHIGRLGIHFRFKKEI